MGTPCKSRAVVIASVLLIVPLLIFLPTLNVIAPDPEFYEPLKMGPFIDKVRFTVITQDDQQVEALLNGEIDLIGDMVDPSFLEQIEASEMVTWEQRLRNGYGFLTINCAKYPLNETALRRAIAFALDKEAIAEDAWEGFAQPLDSIVPPLNPFSVEGQLPYSYYAADSDTGNAILDAAGFHDINSDGFREAPDGSDFDIVAEFPLSGGIGIWIAPILRAAFQSLNLNGTTAFVDFYEYLNRLYFRGDYDMAFLGETLSSHDVDWLAYEFWGWSWEYPDINLPRWGNASYDIWRDQLLHGTSYEEVYEAAIEMQKVFVYECPYIVLYENYYISAYRTEEFEGFVNDYSEGVPGWWTNYKTRRKTAPDWNPFGGTLRWSNSLDVDMFNFMISCPCYCLPIDEWLYEPLIRCDPDGNDKPWLAKSYEIETHEDNPQVAEGHTRFTFDILDNATWSDGIPITPEDVAFTFNYYRDAPGNPFGYDLQDLEAAYSTGNEVIIEFNTESYWHLHTIGYKLIIPKHIFSEIGLEGWRTWNPQPPEELMVTSGPFNVSDYEPGSHVELSYVPGYFYSPNRSAWTPPVTTDFGENGSEPMDVLTIAGWVVTSTSVIVIIGVLVLWSREGG